MLRKIVQSWYPPVEKNELAVFTCGRSSVFSAGFLRQQKSCLLAFCYRWDLLLFLWLCLLFSCFLVLKWNTSHCLPCGNSPGKLFSHESWVQGFCCAILLLGCWFVLFHILKSFGFYKEDTLCMYLFLMSVLIAIYRFYHKNIQKFVQTMMHRYSICCITTSP